MSASSPRIALPLVLLLAILSACASAPLSPELADTRAYCTERPHKRVRVCTPERIPSQAVEDLVKRFEASPDAFTVFVVRGTWADSVQPLDFEVDGKRSVGTLPRMFARVQLAPGTHTLSMTWNGKRSEVELKGQRGEVVFVDIAGSALPWDPPYYWSLADPLGSRERARRSRLVADLKLM